MELHLTDDEARMLHLLVERAHGQIKYQIADANESRFKEQLRQEKVLIEGLMSRFRAAGVEASSPAFREA
jgi:hypothetical protein